MPQIFSSNSQKTHTQHTLETNLLRGEFIMEIIHKEMCQKSEKEEEIGSFFMGIMEGYKDSVISPLSEFNNSMHDIVNYEKGSSSSLKRSRIEASETESTRKERLRRGKMAESFSVLQSMVPSLFPIQKPTREKILTETIEYIGSLEGEAKRLEGLKKSFLEKPVLSSCSYSYLKPSFTASFSNGVAFFGVQLPAKRGLLSKIFRVFEEYHAEILEATVLVNEYQMLTLTGTFAVEGHGANLIEKIKREILVL